MGHGGMGCGMKTIRFVMVIFNIFFFLLGSALLAAGIYVLVDPSLQKIKQVLPINGNPAISTGLSYLEVIAIVVIVLGAVVLLIGFFGCCGAMKQVKIFLILYIVILAIIIIIEIGVVIYFVAFKTKFEEQILPKLKDAVQSTYEGPLGLSAKYNLKKPSAISIAWDFIMYNFQCCGVTNPSDFNGTTMWNRANPWWNASMNTSYQNFTYPLTCCVSGGGGFTKDWNNLPLDQFQTLATCAVSGANMTQTGCYSKIMDVIGSSKTWIIVGAVLILVIELVAFIFAMAMCCRKTDDTLNQS